jgi:hypothetical protein
MVKGDVSHGSEGRKATFFIVRRRQLSWILEPAMATFFMAQRGPGFQFNALKPAKRTQRGLLRPVRRRIRLLELCGKQLSLVANEIAFGEA